MQAILERRHGMQVAIASEAVLDVHAFEKAFEDGTSDHTFQEHLALCRSRRVTGFLNST